MSDLLPLILKKKDGHALTSAEINNFVESIISKKPPPDYQISALLAFIVSKGMTPEETFALTKAKLESGKPFKYAGFPKSAFFVDKHSTGGVGDKVTVPLAPWVTSADERIYFPTISGRALGHTGGTVDKLESMPGFKTGITTDKFYRLLKKNRLAFLSQTPQITPADRILYALRDVTGTVSSIPLITASILSKKLSETLDFLIIDLKAGTGAFMPNLAETEELGLSLARVLDQFKIPYKILMTNMDTPLGLYSGNRLEIKETYDILHGEGPEDSTSLTKTFASLQLQALGMSEHEANQKLDRSLKSGEALKTWIKSVEAQGGDFSALEKALKSTTKTKTYSLKANANGYLKFDVTGLGMSLVELGAGRKTKADKVDVDVGFYHSLKTGDKVEQGQEVLRIHYRDSTKLKKCLERLKLAVHIREMEVRQSPLIYKEIKSAV